MNSDLLLETVDTHTAGEPTRFIVGGLPVGLTRGDVTAARDDFRANFDHLRRLLMQEPRGHADMFGGVIVDPATAAADIGLFFMDNQGYLDMCGHGLIGAVTVLIETGRMAVEDGEELTVETPAGTVRAWPQLDGDSVEAVTIENVASFVLGRETVSLPDVGEITADLVFAGNVFAIVGVSQLELSVRPEHVRSLIEHALDIRTALNEAVDLVHPVHGSPLSVDLVEFADSSDEVDSNLTVFGRGQIDRSPCGTGTCAKMALLAHHGELAVGEVYEHESVIGTRFSGELIEVSNSADQTVVTPRVTGSAYLTGRSTFFLDPDDPLTGFDIAER